MPQAEGGYVGSVRKKPSSSRPPVAPRRIHGTKDGGPSLEEQMYGEKGREDARRLEWHQKARQIAEDLGLVPPNNDAGWAPSRIESIWPDQLRDYEVPWHDGTGFDGGHERPELDDISREYDPRLFPEDNVLNAERIKGTDPRVRGVTDRIGRGDLPNRGKIKDAAERGLPEEWPEDEAVNNDFAERLRRLMLERRDIEVGDNLLELGPRFDVATSLMDLLNTPGFKIGLGGTGALLGVLSYLGANVAEEVLP